MFTLPDKGEGDNDLQSILFQEYIDVLVAGINGVDCVLSGCAITGGADMTPAVAKGAVLSNGVLRAVSAGDVTIGAADATNPRIDLIVVDSSGAKQVRAGTAAVNPKPPARTANDVVLGAVLVLANDTSIETTKITDLRVVRTNVVIARQTTVRTVNTTAAAFSAFASAPSIPDGLFLAGKIIRVRMGGNYLMNQAATPTWTCAISYGGTTMFQDVSAATAQDVDRGSWILEFDLVAQANNDQTLVGWWHMQAVGTKTAPANGIGDMAATNSADTPFTGAAAVDSDAGNRTLDVQFTMSSSNANVETVIECITVELIG